MNFLQLKYVMTIVEEKSISAAARKLYISQPSLSQTLHTVEEELGVELFKRESARLTLSYAGELFVPQAQEMLLNYHNLMRTMNEISNGQRFKLRIGIPVSRSTYIMPKILAALMNKFPMVDIRTVENTAHNLEEQLSQGKIDFAFSHYYQNNKNLVYRPIVTEEWLIAMSPSHPLARIACRTADWQQRPALQLSSLEQDSFILLRQGHSARIVTDGIFQQMDFVPHIILETHNNSVAHSLAIDGLGITIIPENEVRFHTFHKKGAYFAIDKRQYCRKLCLCYHKKMFLTQQFMDIIDLICETVSRIYEESDADIFS